MRRIKSNGHELPVCFESANELVLVKPSGMASELSNDRKKASLLAAVRRAEPQTQPRLPHRLDRVTRGIILVALTDESIAFHNDRIRSGAWGKIYLARTYAPSHGDAERLIGMHKLHLRAQSGRARVVRSGGKPALTEILSLAPAPAWDGEMHVLLRLVTGRFHQIRATLAHLGIPLVDDWIYGTSPGRAHERFYLEHIALRCRMFGEDNVRVVHWHEDPEREAIDPRLHKQLDDFVAHWESGG